MSILLDSLRKSEAQRKIKDAPSIHSAQPYGGAQSRRGRWIPIVMAGLVAIAIAWFGWRQYAIPAADPSRADQAEAGVRPEAGQVAVSEAETPAAEPSSAEPRTPVEQLSQAAAGRDSADSGPADDAPGDLTPSDRIAAYAAPQEPEPAIVDDQMETSGETGPDSEPDSQMGPQQESGLGAEAIEELAGAGRDAPEQPLRPGGAEPAEPEFISYWQLPQSWRSEMPELRITVLVYAEASEDRFLLVNGERLREGDELEGGVVLEAIRRDGAVFSYRSRQFMVKG